MMMLTIMIIMLSFVSEETAIVNMISNTVIDKSTEFSMFS